MSYRKLIATPLVIGVAALALTACPGGSKPGAEEPAPSADVPAASTQVETADTFVEAAAATPDPVCADCGTITAIQERRTEGGNTSRAAIAGAVIGTVAGVMVGSSQFSGDEETLAEVVAGAAGGVAGHQIGKRIAADVYYAVTVDMEAGGTEVITVPDASALSVGQEVRVQGNNIVLN